MSMCSAVGLPARTAAMSRSRTARPGDLAVRKHPLLIRPTRHPAEASIVPGTSRGSPGLVRGRTLVAQMLKAVTPFRTHITY
jgi:hypothetical protein